MLEPCKISFPARKPTLTPFKEHFGLKNTKFNAAESEAWPASHQQQGFCSAFPSSKFASIIYERLQNRAMLVVKPAAQALARDTTASLPEKKRKHDGRG